MNPSEKQNDGWHCGGWEGAEMATLRHMASLTFMQKLGWLEGAQELVAAMHGREASLLPSGSLIRPRRLDEQRGTPPHSTEGGDVGAGGGAAGAEEVAR